MTTDKISLMDAYMIETLRSNGMSNEEMVSELEAGNVGALQEHYDNFDFNELLKLANKDMGKFKKACFRSGAISKCETNAFKELES